ncbi:glycosyltransferase involved in cell wall biosynthesis [Algoriphagus sp. 4150]|uniref:glycosyltransferase family 4 protein n=1 Tax=Algoriphagus sp. 4150 TaxID=2817756 RepID=UPI00285E06A4|nr:glycosyltransferase family 4 protein [Algoriphagus sp. 4150]MDR7127728.1 glycosyltransferase involved in cell wall biosynthesis [Algoriphagus sp. 4150]
MKILFLDTSPIRRGAQVFIVELTDALDQMGEIQTYRFYLYKPDENASSVKIRNQDKVLGFDQGHIFEKIPTLQPPLLYRLIVEIKRIQPDIVLLNGSRTLKYGAAIKRFFPKKVKWISRVIDTAEFWNPGKFTHWYYKKLVIPQLDGTIGVSRASLDSMIRHYKFKKPATVIHRVVDPKKFEKALSRKEARKELGLGDKDEVLLFLGNLTAQKRPDKFISIVHQLSLTHPNLKALVVGDGPLRGDLEYQATGIKNQEPRAKNQETSNETLSVGSSQYISPTPELASDIRHPTPNIFFHGYQQDVSSYLAAADILVLTSDTEGLPGVVLEAAHFRVPTIASEIGGIRECLIDGETGFLIPNRSVDAFCQKITVLFDNPKLRIQLGEKASSFVSQNFRMDKVARQYLDFFNQLFNL